MVVNEAAVMAALASFTESPRGLLTGQAFDFNPPPPSQDLLGNPLLVTRLPLERRPKLDGINRLRRTLADYHLDAPSATTRLRWRACDMIDTVIAALGRRPGRTPSGRAARRRISVYHPYHLHPAFELLVDLPPEVSGEARFLELLLRAGLRTYADMMSAVHKTSFQFGAEAGEYFRAGFRAERLLRNLKPGQDRFAVTQQAYDGYFHGLTYYLFSLVRREAPFKNTHLFSYFYRATYFTSRVNWDGQLQEKPNPHRLPSRTALLFHLQRDTAVLDRFRTDKAFAAQVAAVLKALPTRP